MKLTAAFLKLIRWPNLVFIVITQLLFYTCIQLPVVHGSRYVAMNHKLEWPHFWLLVTSSVLIAAAGYIINDYFDLNIDQINKPDEIIIQKHIRRRWAIFWHLTLSAIGVALAFCVGYIINTPLLGILNFICVLLLWVYSTTFKKKLLIGNIIISLLTAWVVLVLYFSEIRVQFWNWTPEFRALYQHIISVLFKYAIVYGGYAFIISLIREVVKDIEDMEGDAKYGCKTMPIVWGVPATKMFAAVWLVVLILSLLIVSAYGFIKGWWLGSLYTIGFIALPLMILLRRLYYAVSVQDYHQLSTLIKVVMLTGILSMIFFKLYM